MQRKMASIEEFGRFMPPGIVFRRKPFEEDELDPGGSIDHETDEGIDESAQDRRKKDEEEEEEREARGKGKGKGNGKKTDDDEEDPYDLDAIEQPGLDGRRPERIVTYYEEDGSTRRFYTDDQGNVDFQRGQVQDNGQGGGDGTEAFLEEPEHDPAGSGDPAVAALEQPADATVAGGEATATGESGKTDTSLTLDQVRASQQTAETELQQANTAAATSDAALESYRNSYVPEWAKAGEAYKANPEAFERHWRRVTERNLEQANTAAERLNDFVEEHGTELDEAKFKQYQQLRAAYEEPLQEIARARGISGYRDGETSGHRGAWGDSQVQLERLQQEHLAPVREAYTAYQTAHGTAQRERQEAVAAGEAFEGLESRYNTAEQTRVEAANAAALAEASEPAEPSVVAPSPYEGVGYTMSAGPAGPATTAQPPVAQPPMAGGVDFTTSDDDLVESPGPGIDQGVGYTMSAGPAGPATTAQPPVAQPPAAGGVDFTTSDDDLVESPVREEDTEFGLQETQTRSADELGAGTDTDRPDTRREFDAADPTGPTARSELQQSDLPGYGMATVQPGVDDRREFDAPSDADTATSSVDTIVGSIDSHNQGVLQEQAGERSRAAGQKGYADDYETSGNSNSLDLIRGNPERGIEPLNADNFRERMAQLPSQLHLGGESVATAELDPSQGHVFTSASPEERAIEQKSLDRRNQARYGQEAEKLRHWAESGYLTVGKTETPEIAVITRPDMQGQVFTDASPQESAVEQKSLERRNAALTRQFEQEVVEAKAQGKVIVLQDPPTPGERMSQAAEVLVPGYGLYKTVQRANHPDSDGGEYVTEREKKAIALEIGMTALDVVPIPVAAAVKPLARSARTLVDAGGNFLSRIKGDVPNVRLDLFDQRVKVDPKTQLPPVAPAAPESTAYRRFPEQRNLFGERQTPVIEGSGDFSPVLEERVAGAANQTRLDQRFGPEYTPGGAYGHLKSDPDYLANLQAQYDYLGTQPINRSMPGAPAGSPEGTPAGGGNVRSAASPDLYVAQQTELALPQLTPSTPQPTYLNQFQVQPVSGTRPVLSTAQLRGNIPEAVAGSTPYVQTQSGLYVPAAAVSPDLYAAQQQTVAAPSTSPAGDAAPAVGAGTSTGTSTDVATDRVPEAFIQDAPQASQSVSPEEDTSQQTGTGPNTVLGGQPDLAPTDRTGTDEETTTGTEEETQPGTGHIPDFGYGVVPHDETLPDDQINTGGQPDLETPNLYDAELATAQQAQTGNLLDLQDATQATQRTDPRHRSKRNPRSRSS